MTFGRILASALFASSLFGQQGTIQDRPIPKPHLIRGEVTKMDRADEPKNKPQGKTKASSTTTASAAASGAIGEIDPAKRHAAAVQSFREDHACPANNRNDGECPGFVIGYAKGLACGGVDEAANLQWRKADAAESTECEPSKPAK
jgi:hypothetical protein